MTRHQENREKGEYLTTAGSLMTVIWGLLSLMIVAPPLLAAHGYNFAATVLYVFFSAICHQSPDRVFTLFDWPFAVCHRCTGIYLGFFLGALPRISRKFPYPDMQRTWILAALVPLAFDVFAPYCEIWKNTIWSRFLTGLAFGIGTSVLLLQGLAEFVAEAPWRIFTPGGSRRLEAFHD